MARQIAKSLEEAKELWPEIPVGKAQDLTNQKFNRLTCLYRSNNKNANNGKRSYWVCQCECRNYCLVESYKLKTGHTQSCGCYMREQTQKFNLNDLTGKQFGRLTVRKRVGTDNWRSPIWECICQCGNITNVTTHNLVSNHTTSCGCYNREQVQKINIKDLTNQQFGFLLAICPLDERKRNNVVWKCKCLNCGNITYVITSNLTGGLTRSCGCINSYAELQINQQLINLNINFKSQYSFKDLRDINPLRFDFAFFNDNQKLLALLEYQGEQHFRKDNSEFGLQQRTKTDQMKKDYCKEHNIPLYEIIYTENIEERLKEILGEIYGN